MIVKYFPLSYSNVNISSYHHFTLVKHLPYSLNSHDNMYFQCVLTYNCKIY